MDYTEQELDNVFYVAPAVPGKPGYVYDCDGRMICRWEYGKQSACGWQVDHDPPLALAGFFGWRFNLRPRHWFGNTSAGGALGNVLKAFGENPYSGLAGALVGRFSQIDG
jgi:hypothetical protein